MALCTACDRLSRILSVNPNRLIRDVQHSKATDLLESAEKCRLCKYLISCIGDDIYTSVKSHNILTIGEKLTLNPKCRGRLTYSFYLASSFLCHFRLILETTQGDDYTGFCVIRWAEEGSPASNSGFAPLNFSPSVDPTSTIRMVASWLKDCCSGHEACTHMISGGVIGQSDDPALPSRVLDLGNKHTSYHIKLLETNGMHGQYCALSHCWGRVDKQPLKTTRGTLGDHVRGIEFKQLPKTFQDAVDVTRGIGVRYLWIDSLCIVQDDIHDWKNEAEKMGGVYERAVLTIAASGAEDSTRGCFISKSRELSSEPIPYFPDYRDTFESGLFYLHQVFDTSPFWTPLQKRGWAFQEWRLSRRIVHFTEGGVSWKCKELEIDEYDRKIDMEQYPQWDSLLERYSRAEFTYNEDCLIALRGLAKEMQIAREDHYHFGIWTADLPEQLLWMREELFADGLTDTPSWSWASKLGPKIFWSSLLFPEPICRQITPETISIEDTGRMEIRNVYIKRCTTSRSSVLCSSYTSRTGLKDAKTIMESYVDEDAHYLYGWENPSRSPFGVAIFDSEPSSDLYCLFVLHTKATGVPEKVEGEKKTSRFWVLILQLATAVTGADTFRRVGVGISLSRPEHGQWSLYSTINII